MTNSIALSLAIVIISVVLADMFYFHIGLPVFFGKNLARITSWIAFWR